MWSNVWASSCSRSQNGHRSASSSNGCGPNGSLSSKSSNCSCSGSGENRAHEQSLIMSRSKQEIISSIAHSEQTEDNKTQSYSQQTENCGSPLMRFKHAICSSLNGFIYIHGGRSGNLALDDDLWRFDAHESSWTQLQTSGARPPSLQEHSLVEWRHQLYLFGGQVSASQQEDNFWRLDLGSLEWRSLCKRSSLKLGAHLGPSNRRAHSAVVYKDSMYVYGGYEDLRGSSGQLWQYDLLNERWELRNNLGTSFASQLVGQGQQKQPEPRHGHSAVVYKDSMWVYGGLSDLKPLSDLWRWSWRERRWFRERARGRSPGRLYGHSAIEAFGSMFVFGGERRGKPTRSLWRLDLASLSWQKIRAKGPRPEPTCWHAAIANPLSILDEANYIIEGGDVALSSLSDNCFGSALSAPQPDELAYCRQPTALAAAVVEAPVGLGAVKMEPGEQQQQQQGRDAPALRQQNPLRRKLKRRLSFLSRRKRPINSSSCNELAGARQQQQRKLQCSLSASENLISVKPRVAGREPAKQAALQMEATEPRGGGDSNANILDSLDSHIKQMFESSDMELLGGARQEDHQLQQKSQAAAIAQRESSVSQFSAFGAPPSSRLSSQTYQTARESFDSSATLKTMAGKQEPLTQSNVAPQPARRRRNSSAASRPPRPRSEIVQSLIERADARIKHLYTPFFHANQRDSSALLNFSANDPLLGRLQNHKMFERQQRHQQQAPPPPSRASQAIGLPGDKSKRHTIHQTMTYYNLYFAEEQRSLASAADDELEEEAKPRAKQQQQRDDSSLASTTRATASSLSAALVGVREGSSTSSSVDGRRLQADTLSVSTQQSSGSHTICNNSEHNFGPAGDLRDSAAGHDDGEELDEQLALLSTNRKLGVQLQQQLQQQRQQQQQQQQQEQSDNEADNTSLSFSVIAEFEEDDMLQYSSPTEPAAGDYARRKSTDEEEDDEDEGEEQEESSRDSEPVRMQVDSDRSPEGNTVLRAGQPVGCVHEQLRQKSTSSGYDSNTHLSASLAATHHHCRQRASSSATHERQQQNGRPMAIGNQQQTQQQQRNKQHTTSSTTADSLALTTATTTTIATTTTSSEPMSYRMMGAETPSPLRLAGGADCPQQVASKSLPSSPPDDQRAEEHTKDN